ncbi:MAG: ribonuclease R [Cardiobacteriaceae bacterium]|nr:ribonuclease R [Cardiobacteriaceae bacterium]
MINAKDWQQYDPSYSAESDKYPTPIPSRDVILQWLHEQSNSRQSALSFEEIFQSFALPEEVRVYFKRRILAMLKAGQLTETKRSHFLPLSTQATLTGKVIAHPEGYGFFVPDDGSADGFIPPKHMAGILHGDKISAKVLYQDGQGKRDFAPLKVLEHGLTRVVGKVEKSALGFWLRPDNRRLPMFTLTSQGLKRAKVGQMVLAEVVKYPSQHQLGQVEISYVLGEAEQAGIEVEMAIAGHQLPVEFSKQTHVELEQWGDEVREEDKIGRKDLRHLPFVTIDGLSARDFDDAVYAKKSGENYRLYVAIADVSHYVSPQSALDDDARERATSVYFPNRVVPMLPEALSNGLCSLNPRVDRLALVCAMTINTEGKILRYQFQEAVICSHERLTYDTVESIFIQDPEQGKLMYPKLVKPLRDLVKVYDALKQARLARHAIEFELPEAEIHYDNEGRIESITAAKRLTAHQLIEECMVAANVCAAQFLLKHKRFALFRNHEPPLKIEPLLDMAKRFGLKGFGGEVTPEWVGQLLHKAREQGRGQELESSILRAMSAAVYSPECLGHFGLALSEYSHFTSPIRRYPDLLVHRAIVSKLRGHKKQAHEWQELSELGAHCSFNERRADDASREVLDKLKCRFMQPLVGQSFQATVNRVSAHGLGVMLNDYFVEGFIPVAQLTDDYYVFEYERLVGRRTRRVFKVGDGVKVTLVQVSREDRRMEFMLSGLKTLGKPFKKKETKEERIPKKVKNKVRQTKERDKPRKKVKDKTTKRFGRG